MSNKMVAWIAKILLITLEIFENQLLCILYSTILMVCSVVSIYGSIIGFYNSTKTAEKIVAFVCITSQLNSILLYVAVFIYREKLLRLFEKLEKKQEHSDVILNRTEVFIKNKLIWFFVSTIVLCLGFIVPPLIKTSFEENFNDKRSLLIPFWYSCGGKGSNGTFCQEIPIISRMTLHALNMYQATSLGIHLFAYLLSFTLYGMVAGELEMHMDIIGKIVDRFNKLTEEIEAKKDSQIDDIEEQLCQQFLQIIKHKQFLHRCIVDTMDTWKLYASLYYGSTFLDVTLFLFGIITQADNEFSLSIRAMALVTFRLLMALIVASYSQNISHLNEDFLNIMSRIRWYNRKRKYCQMYHQMLTLHQTLNLMKIAGVVELNLNCYARLLRNIYSVVNLIYLSPLRHRLSVALAQFQKFYCN